MIEPLYELPNGFFIDLTSVIGLTYNQAYHYEITFITMGGTMICPFQRPDNIDDYDSYSSYIKEQVQKYAILVDIARRNLYRAG